MDSETSAQTDPPEGQSPLREDSIVLFFFDVLGFAERVDELGLAEILRLYEDLLEMVRARAGGRVVMAARPVDQHTMVPVMGWLDLESTYFSDTILLWTKYDDLRFQVSVDIVLDFFCDCFKNGLPLRGAIAFGDAVMDRQRGIFLGHPIIEAARAESSQRWCGCGFGPSLDDFPRLGPADRFMPYSDHAKPGREDYLRELVLDWPRRWRASPHNPDLLTCIEKYRRPGHEDYWDTTTAFVEHSQTNELWWQSLTP